MKLNIMLFAFLMLLAVMLFFFSVPQENRDLLNTIVTAFISATTGGAIGYAIAKKEG